MLDRRLGLLNISNPNTILPLRITSLIYGKRWSLAILRYDEPRHRITTDEFLGAELDLDED